MRKSQLSFFKASERAYGGVLLNTRKGRAHGRPLSTKDTMHLTLRSSLAVQERSFLKKTTAHQIQLILRRFSKKYGVKLLSIANVGNHLHIHLKLGNRQAYRPFIRAITSAISMAATGASRWETLAKKGLGKFWDYRPFTRIIVSRRARLILEDYLKVNQLEGLGFIRSNARALVWMESGRWLSSG